MAAPENHRIICSSLRKFADGPKSSHTARHTASHNGRDACQPPPAPPFYCRRELGWKNVSTASPHTDSASTANRQRESLTLQRRARFLFLAPDAPADGRGRLIGQPGSAAGLKRVRASEPLSGYQPSPVAGGLSHGAKPGLVCGLMSSFSRGSVRHLWFRSPRHRTHRTQHNTVHLAFCRASLSHLPHFLAVSLSCRAVCRVVVRRLRPQQRCWLSFLRVHHCPASAAKADNPRLSISPPRASSSPVAPLCP